MLQRCTLDEDSRRRPRRRCRRSEPRRHPGRPVVVMREPRLELCHPDDFHALRDVDVPAATDFEVALPLLFPRHGGDVDGQRSPPAFMPFSCSCAVSCCDGLRLHDNLVSDHDIIPLPVHYVAAQDDDDDYVEDDDDDDDGDDSVYSDNNRHLPSKFLLLWQPFFLLPTLLPSVARRPNPLHQLPRSKLQVCNKLALAKSPLCLLCRVVPNSITTACCQATS